MLEATTILWASWFYAKSIILFIAERERANLVVRAGEFSERERADLLVYTNGGIFVYWRARVSQLDVRTDHYYLTVGRALRGS